MGISGLRSMWNILQNRNPFLLFRRKRSRAQRVYERQFSRFTLIVRERWQFLLFLFGKHRFEAGGWFQDQRASLSILVRFMGSIFGPAFFAIILVVGMEVLDRLLLAQCGQGHRLSTPLPRDIADNVGHDDQEWFANRHRVYLNQIPELSEEGKAASNLPSRS